MSNRVPATVVRFDSADRAAVLRVLDSGRIVQGPEVAAFEDDFSKIVEGRPAVAVNSGTSALHLALLASGVGPGDEVIVPSFSFAASANAVAMTGATPVFADIDPSTFNVAPDSIAANIGPRTVAVMAVHLYGLPADMRAITRLASRHSLLVIEDAAQAVGAAHDGVPVGALGDIAAFSFYATKNVSCGEGGMVVTRDASVARTVRLLRNQGMERVYHNEVPGLNNRMTEISGALGRLSLAKLEDGNRNRRRWAGVYDSALTGALEIPDRNPHMLHAFHQYTVRTSDRDRVVEHLNERGVEARVFYPTPIHRLPAFNLDLELPETERAAREAMSLPIRPDLSADEVEFVTASVRDLLGKAT